LAGFERRRDRGAGQHGDGGVREVGAGRPQGRRDGVGEPSSHREVDDEDGDRADGDGDP
jgi:hypothetical protein